MFRQLLISLTLLQSVAAQAIAYPTDFPDDAPVPSNAIPVSNAVLKTIESTTVASQVSGHHQ